MNGFSFTDSELKIAAAEVRAELLRSIAEGENCSHEFSEAFEKEMRGIYARSIKVRRRRGAWRKIAAAIAIIIFGLTVWLSVDAEARGAVMKWLRETYESRIVYRFDTDKQEIDELPKFTITALPDGFSKTDVYEDEEWYSAVYENKSGKIIVFEYRYVKDTTVEELTAEGGITVEKLEINGMDAEYAYSEDDTRNLTWFDTDNGIVFNIDSNLQRDEIIRIGESVKKE